MQYTKAKYYNLLLLSNLWKLKYRAESKLSTLTIRRRINAHEMQKILRGKTQLKTPLFVLSYKVEISQNYTKPQLSQLASSQYNPPGCSQANKDSHKHSPLPSKLLFPCVVSLGDPTITKCGRLITHIDLTPCKNAQSSRNLVLSECVSFLYRRKHATNSTLSPSLISTGSLNRHA